MALLVAAAILVGLVRPDIRAGQSGLLDAVLKLPAGVRDVLGRAVGLAAVGIPAAAVGVGMARRQRARLGRLLLATVTAVAATVVVGRMLLAASHPAVFTARFPPVAWVAGLAAMASVAAPG